jgi:small subunit ribosomal protein S10
MFIKKIKLLLNSGKKTKFENVNQITLPKNRTLFTVLRSPHIDKKSREQFQFIHYKKKLFVEIENINKSALFIFFLKNSQFPGVEMEISLSYSSCLNLLKTKK